MKQPKGAEKEKNPQGADQHLGVSKEYKNYDIGLKSLPPSETPSVEKIVESALKKEYSTGSEKDELGVRRDEKTKQSGACEQTTENSITAPNRKEFALPSRNSAEKPCADKQEEFDSK